MRFDDRLLTVLSQPAGDRRDLAVRWRQLVDLVARAGSNGSSPTVAQALETIRADAPNVDESLRAAAARAVAALPLPIGLLEYFASDELTVSAPVLAAATLDPGQWHSILAATGEETRRFVETLHPEIRPQPRAELTDQLIEAPAEAHLEVEAEPPPSLHDVVERIERRRRLRASMKRAAVPASAVEGSASLFRWECGPGGEIAWVDGVPRGALIGRSISRTTDGEGDLVDPDIVRAFTVRAPFRDAALVLGGEGTISGEWKISGVPAFDPADGRFRGYRGIALREQEDRPEVDQAVELLPDPDSLRELVHEIKTPLNAIIGFAEIIEGQYLGPADLRYRERAQEIVRQARLLVTAIDDLDFAAKVHSSAAGTHGRVNLGELVERMLPALRRLGARRLVDVDGPRMTRDATASVEPELADRLVFRMCSTLIEQADARERLRISVERAGERWRVSMTRPAGLSALSDEQLLEGESNLEQGFSLRLLRGLARIAGVDLVAAKGTISLLFLRG